MLIKIFVCELLKDEELEKPLPFIEKVLPVAEIYGKIFVFVNFEKCFKLSIFIWFSGVTKSPQDTFRDLEQVEPRIGSSEMLYFIRKWKNRDGRRGPQVRYRSLEAEVIEVEVLST